MTYILAGLSILVSSFNLTRFALRNYAIDATANPDERRMLLARHDQHSFDREVLLPLTIGFCPLIFCLGWDLALILVRL